MITVHASVTLEFRSIILRCARVPDMNIVECYYFTHLHKAGSRESIVGAPKICAILGSDNGHLNLTCSRCSNRTRKADPGVGIVCLCVGARCVERALDRVRGAGDVGPAFCRGERWSDQHQQEPDNADDDEEFEERKTPNAFGVTL